MRHILRGRYVCICEISFQSIPFRIGFEFSVVNRYIYVTLHCEELVVTAFVDVILCKCASAVCLFKSAYSFLTVIGILSGAVGCISHQQSFAIAFDVFHHPTVVFRLTQYPFFDFFAFSLYFCSDYVLIALCLKV